MATRGTGGADMSRNQSLAGQTVKQGDFAVTYDKNGYATKAINTKHEIFTDPGYDGIYAGGNFGFTDGTPNGTGGGSSSGGGGSRGSSGGSRGSGSGSGSSSSSYYDSVQATDLSSYLNQMYSAYNEAQLAALKSTYEQNLADLQAAAEKIPQTYQTARNEAASQNDLARMAFNEYANARGLNTGTSGQAALANSAVLQSNLSDISTQESDALAENALEQNRLAIEYRNAAVQAQAEGNYQLAQALYNEYVRQDNAAMQSAQLAQEQANWEASFNLGSSQWQQEFDAQQRQYQDTVAAQQKEYAYNLAMTMLAAGVMPDTNTLNSAGISAADAMNMRLAALSSGSSSGSGGNSSYSSGESGGSKMTLTTAKQAANAGVFSDDVLSVLRNNGYSDEMLSAIYGYEPPTSSGGEGISDKQMKTIYNGLSIALSEETPSSAEKYLNDLIDQYWDIMTTAQRTQITSLANRYGFSA